MDNAYLRRCALVATVVACASAHAMGARRAGARFIALDPEHGKTIFPLALSPDGKYFLVASIENFKPTYLLYTPDQGFMPLTEPGALRVGVASLADDGHWSVAIETSSRYPNMLWVSSARGAGKMELPPGVRCASGAPTTILPDGSAAVGTIRIESKDETPTTYAFRWTPEGGVTTLGDLPGGSDESNAADMSADGSVVVGTGTPGDTWTEAFIWTSGLGMRTIGVPEGFRASYATSVSADGAVVAGYAAGTDRSEAFIWTARDGFTMLGDLPGGPDLSHATAISGDGKTVGGFGTTEKGRAAFIWDAEHGMRSLAELGEALELEVDARRPCEIIDISYDGNAILGWGYGLAPRANRKTGWYLLLGEQEGGNQE